MTITEILNIPEARALVEQIEELIGEEEASLVRIREELIEDLRTKYGYDYAL